MSHDTHIAPEIGVSGHEQSVVAYKISEVVLIRDRFMENTANSYKARMDEILQNDELKEWVQENTKFCPGCHVVVER